jgi:hypothetical protein
LENDGNTALLISKYGLDCQKFHHNWVDIGWRDCDLREWLNSDFLSCAFNNDEQSQIAESVIFTGSNLEYGIKGCGVTRDKVFCLSIEEAKKYFASNSAIKCQPTSYTVSRDEWKCYAGNCNFWLRSPGHIASYAARVYYNGAVDWSGDSVDDIDVVRPAMRVKVQ